MWKMVLTKSILKMRKVDKRTEENIKKIKLFLKNTNILKRNNIKNESNKIVNF